MPALVTHYYFASKVLEKTKPHLSCAASADPMSFCWGALGPDPLFFYQPLFSNTVTQTAHLMHEKQIDRAFSVLARECAAMQSPSATAYALGFCTHYILDRTIHPYVTYMSNYKLNPSYPSLGLTALHNLCESELDRILIKKMFTENSSTFRDDRLLSLKKPSCDAASHLLSTIAWKAYGERISPQAVRQSMHHMLWIKRILQNPTGRRADTLASLERLLRSDGTVSSLMRPSHPLRIDCANRRREAWCDASTAHMRRYESFFDLLRRAEQPALRLMDSCYDSIETGTKLPDNLFSLNYLGLPEQSGIPFRT